MSEKITFAMRAFLHRVEYGEVMKTRGYTKRRGGYDRFIGGEATAKKAAKLGLITMPGHAELGRPSKAILTESGRAALSTPEAPK